MSTLGELLSLCVYVCGEGRGVERGGGGGETVHERMQKCHECKRLCTVAQITREKFPSLKRHFSGDTVTVV